MVNFSIFSDILNVAIFSPNLKISDLENPAYQVSCKSKLNFASPADTSDPPFAIKNFVLSWTNVV